MHPLTLAILSIALFLNGCAGYHLGSARPKFMDGIKTVAVPSFENTTLIPRLEVLGANTLIRQIQQDGTLTVEGSSTADAIVECSITRIHRSSARTALSDVLSTREYGLTINVDYTVTKRTTGERLSSGEVSGQTSFFVTGNDVNQDEQQAIPLALEQAATRLTSRLTEGW
jgi:hypothetical protein